MYTVSQKSSALKLFCDIFTLAKYISVKFCYSVANFYPYIFTDFGRFMLTFSKMILMFLGVLIVFTVSSFEFRRLHPQ